MTLYYFIRRQRGMAIAKGDLARAASLSRQLLDVVFWLNEKRLLQGNWTVELGG